MGSVKYFEPGNHKSGVPSVLGYNLRDAINVLESAGLEVDFNGTGYVVAQSISPGSTLRPGSRVRLTLNQ